MENRLRINRDTLAELADIQLLLVKNEGLKGGRSFPNTQSGFLNTILTDYVNYLHEGLLNGKNYSELISDAFGGVNSLSDLKLQNAELQRQNKVIIDRVYQLIYMQLFAQVDLYESSPGWENQIGSVFDPSNSYGEVFAEIQKIVERDQQQFFKGRAKKKIKL
ncbi:hypothetical protein ACW2AE_07825 [Limosilactobacillus fermentum]|jgi:hypothetical protein|uniref:Uncharacterized protein n=1 Tax=Limosilactobacillus fermentum TaxID=1613 RepID=A0A2K2TFU6_LIMFE|nr:hypothetical protein [Limosilactobacillus fermentum]MBS7688148.1 hypothetical protein [Limosilactobacillus fermentum]MCT3437615.1 hypothetical protein [Limosilactobacillus fermentum]MCT3442371.1 hypothetical protein [Limosilactobacillus fermentum]MCT3452244.1 hypothetical protein [Limosilactobacillus fermentum]MDU2968032.1 hypothetical protein [Limosilactobacillus fermentum]